MAPKKAPVEKGAGTKDSQVIKRLHQILKTADLEKTTVKNIQKQLEAELGVPMSDRKQFIREEVRCRTTSSFSFHPRTHPFPRARMARSERQFKHPGPARVFPIIRRERQNFQTCANAHHAPPSPTLRSRSS